MEILGTGACARLKSVILGFEMTGDSEQHLAIMQARNKAFRWAKGQTGHTPSAMLYHEARRIARQASPEMMRKLIDLVQTSEDDRVASVCAIAVLDRAGVKPIDFDPNKEKDERPKFNPRDYSPQELDVIEAALRLMLRPPAMVGGEETGERREPRQVPLTSDTPGRTRPRPQCCVNGG